MELSLILLRGIPGSGKSTLAKLLSENGKYPVLSVDDYFINPQTGEYTFDHKNNHLAYSACAQKTEEQLKLGAEKIFVDNTFVFEWEMEPYFKLAARYSSRIFVITVENRHKGQNIHEITDEQIKKMAERFKVILY
jgi:predicted kinase